MWWAVTRPGTGRVTLTAPSFPQVNDILWPEVRLLYGRALERGYKLGPPPALDPATGWRLGQKAGVFGRTTDKPERLAGLSGAELFYIIDEASGYPEALIQAILGNLAGGGRVLMTSNPTQLSGSFYDAFHDKEHLWQGVHISSLESPNFHGGDIPGLATPEWHARQLEDWGVGTPDYEVHVLGQFPSASSDAVISVALKDAAQKVFDPELFEAEDNEDALEFGVDVARGGDDSTVIAPRRGKGLGKFRAMRGIETDTGPKVADAVMEEVRTHRRGKEVPRVKIDCIGVGASAYDALMPYSKGRDREIELLGVNSSERSDDEERYYNLRSQLHYAVRDWLRAGAGIPSDAHHKKLGGELIAAKSGFDNRGRHKVEPKDEIKIRLKRSPDYADALALAVYSPRRTRRTTVGTVVMGTSIDDLSGV
jgi:phage terminase large subunit